MTKFYKPPKRPGKGRASGPVVSREAVLRIIGRTSVARSDNPLRDIRSLVLQLPSARRTIFNDAPARVGHYVCKECRREDGDCPCLDGPTLIRLEGDAT